MGAIPAMASQQETPALTRRDMCVPRRKHMVTVDGWTGELYTHKSHDCQRRLSPVGILYPVAEDGERTACLRSFRILSMSTSSGG